LQPLSEEQALAVVTAAIRRLFPVVTENRSRDLARAVIRDLAGRGVLLVQTSPDQADGG
jgi:hypothetical protein